MNIKMLAVAVLCAAPAAAEVRSAVGSLPSRVLGDVPVSLSLEVSRPAAAVTRVACRPEELGDVGDGQSDVRTVRTFTADNVGLLLVTVRGQALPPIPLSALSRQADSCAGFQGARDLSVVAAGGRALGHHDFPIEYGRYLRVSFEQPRIQARFDDDSLSAYGPFTVRLQAWIVSYEQHGPTPSAVGFEEQLPAQSLTLR